MITENDKRFIEMVANLDIKVNDAQVYVKEHYDVETEYVSEENELYINSGDNALNAASAKDYFESQIAPGFVDIIFD